MSFLDTKYKKKSFTLSSLLLALIIFLMFYLGLSYHDEELIENGISINFGNTDFGQGVNQPVSQPMAVSQPEEVEVEEQIEQPVEVSSVTEEKIEEVITEEVEEAPIIKPEETTPEEKVEVVEEPVKEVEKPAKEQQKPSKSTTDALSSIINSSISKDADTNSNEGPDTIKGDKGSLEGDPYASSYYGAPGEGNGSAGYGLNGRKLLTNGKVQQECNESGTVVVKIEVDRNGNVMVAIPGVKGTTNNDPCLLKPAKETAFLHKWNVDSNAPSRQIGFVVVNFKLGE